MFLKAYHPIRYGVRMISKFTLGCILCVVAGAGCASSPSVFTVRLQDIDARRYYDARDTFRHDETPAVVVSGQSGHDVTVQLRKSDLDMIVQKNTFHIKRDELKWVHWKGLPPGKYIAELVVRDKTNAVTAFVMEPESADKR